jgi:UDP-glucuronate decarboxylase
MALSKIIQEDVVAIVHQISSDLQQLDDATLLISGGAGFIGAYFLDVIEYANKHILKNPCQVYCIDNYITGLPDRIQHLSESSNIYILNNDICAPITIKDDINFIIHAAGIASPTHYRLHPIETIDAAVNGLRNLLDFAQKGNIRSFLFLSSSEVYGNPTPDNIPTPETYNGNVSFTGPRACYDESKRFGETMCGTYRRLFNMPIKIARPGNVYGPGMRLDDGRVIPDFINNVLKGKDIVILSDGKPTRCFCYITDAMIGFFKILFTEENSEFNISNDEQEISMYDLAKEVVYIAKDQKLRVKFQKSSDSEYLTDNPSRRHLDLTKARTVLCYLPKVGLRQGLARTLAWSKEQYLLETR